MSNMTFAEVPRMVFFHPPPAEDQARPKAKVPPGKDTGYSTPHAIILLKCIDNLLF
jgi:hypothetical protein